MNRFRITKQKLIILLICAAFLLTGTILACIRSSIVSKQVSQQMAKRWSEKGDVTQISCFFTREANVQRERILALEHALDEALEQASIVIESENDGARLWADAYSATGRVPASTSRGTITVKAMGVGGDFFAFHPQELLYGNYFYESDVNQDYVVIDEEIAWQLFGGIEVNGKMIDVNGKPHLIAGVIKRPQGKMDQAAGLTESILYMSYQSLENLGEIEPISYYEIVMPNPIKDFGMNMLKEALMMDVSQVDYVENTGRFSYANSLKLLQQFGYRSMNGKAIIYPYWENVARGMEDRLALLTLFVVLFFSVPGLIFLIWIIWRWKHKKWTLETIRENLGRWKNQLLIKRSAMRREKKEKKKVKRNPIHISFDEEDEYEEIK